MEKDNKLNILGIIALVIVIACFGAFYYFDQQDQKKEIEEFQKNEKIETQKAAEKADAISKYLYDAHKTVSDNIKGFTIFGDDYVEAGNSLGFEAQFETVLENKLFYELNTYTNLSASLQKYSIEIPVENHAVVNESFNTMLTRIGIKPLILAKDITIPADFEEVEITFKTDGDNNILFSKQEKEKLGTTTIDGIVGAVYFNADKDSKEEKYKYSFVRKEAGKSKKVSAGTKISTEGTNISTDLIPIVFYGNNDYVSVDAYIKSQKNIVDRQKNSGGRFIVIANTEKDSELDKAMTKQFGDNYIRTYAENSSALDKEILAAQVYDRMNQLGFFNNIKEKIEETQKTIQEYDNTNQ